MFKLPGILYIIKLYAQINIYKMNEQFNINHICSLAFTPYEGNLMHFKTLAKEHLTLAHGNRTANAHYVLRNCKLQIWKVPLTRFE